MIHCNIREIFQNFRHSKVQGYLSSRIASLQQIFNVLVLSDELLLHGPPDHLNNKYFSKENKLVETFPFKEVVIIINDFKLHSSI